MSFIEININNSFNKEKTQSFKEESAISDSTLSNNDLSHHTEVNSINIASLTNSALNGQVNVIQDNRRKTIMREIFIAASGTIIGSIITYLILGIK